MNNTFCAYPLHTVQADLVRVALGQTPADIVIKNVNLVSTTTAEILPHTDIGITRGRVAYVGLAPHTADHCIGDKTQVIDATDLYATPGLLDAHMHVESSMVGISEYGRATIPHGTVGIFADPHEVANVRGLEGVRAMWADAERTPLKAMLTTPSCVPAVEGVEDTGSRITAKDVAETMSWDSVAGLGEMMNDPGILACDENPLAEVAETLKVNKTVTGHYTMPDFDRGLNAYIATGVSADHEAAEFEDVLARLRLGMYVQLRQGSAWHNLPKYLPQLLKAGVDLRLCCLCTDDNHPHTFIEHGHMDYLLRLCVEMGCDPIAAVQMATLNTATSFGLAHEMGSIAPGKCADIVLFDNLHDFNARLVLIDGNVVAKEGKTTFEVEPYRWPEFMTQTMNVGFNFSADTFKINPPAHAAGEKNVRVRAIDVKPGDTLTGEVFMDAPIVDGSVSADYASDLLKMAVFDRHHGKEGTHSFGFIHGFGIHGALAQTVSHDAHNLLVMGDNDADMALACQTLLECGGGEVAVQDGKVLAKVELPVCGLMSTKRVEDVAAEVARVREAWATMGCKLPSPFMTMGVMSLACIPLIRLTNRGYVNCVTYQMEDLFA